MGHNDDFTEWRSNHGGKLEKCSKARIERSQDRQYTMKYNRYFVITLHGMYVLYLHMYICMYVPMWNSLQIIYLYWSTWKKIFKTYYIIQANKVSSQLFTNDGQNLPSSSMLSLSTSTLTSIGHFHAEATTPDHCSTDHFDWLT